MEHHSPRRRRVRRSRLPRLMAALLILLVGGGLFFRWSNTSLQITEFDPVFADLPEGFDGCRIVVLADLHSTEFGPQNENLFSAVESQKPDYILPDSQVKLFLVEGEMEQTYTVQEDDTMWLVAPQYNTTVERIAAYNEIDVHDPLWVGQVLRIPPAAWLPS